MVKEIIMLVGMKWLVLHVENKDILLKFVEKIKEDHMEEIIKLMEEIIGNHTEKAIKLTI